MRASARTWRTGIVVLVIAGLAALTLASGPNSTAQAQEPTDFGLSISSTTLPSTGGTAELVVSIDPGESAIAAIGATVTVDAATAVVVECIALVGLGACGETAPGELNIQTVDPAGWSTPTELFRITYDVSSLVAEAAVDIEPIEAFDVAGALISGSVIDGTIGVVLNGDVDCGGSRTIGDALIIAQYVVGNRSAGSCPLDDPTAQIDLTGADVNRDGVINIADALWVARCTVGLLNCDA